MTATADPLLARLDELAPRIRAETEDAERSASLPPALVRALAERELFRLWIPRRYGGLELSLPEALTIHRAAARLDGAVGWAVMIGAGGGLFAAWLESDTAAEIYTRPDALIAGSGAPTGAAERVPGGYRISGRWRYASGARHATAFTANCMLSGDGSPRVRAMTFSPEQVRVIPTWDTSGLRATGSEDIAVENAFVPERRSFALFTEHPRESGPLYRVPFEVLTELPVVAVGAGIARHALDAFAELARQKMPFGATAPLAEDALVRSRFAEATGQCGLADAALDALAQQAWQAACAGTPLSPRERAGITATATAIVAGLRGAIDALAALAGMTAIRQGEPFARAWRDLQALNAHYSVAPPRLAAVGEVLLGVN